MSPKTHGELVNFIWGICNLLRGPYKRNEYRKVILPLTVLRRFDCVLAPTKERVLVRYRKIRRRADAAIWADLRRITKSSVVNGGAGTFAAPAGGAPGDRGGRDLVP